MDLQRSISLEINSEHVGSERTVLVDRVLEPGEDDEFVAVGHADCQASDVDGVTHLVPGAVVKPGDLVQVEIVDAMEYDLVGRVTDR
jgi:ribosomal protein S12 methylthiotransferase